MAKNVFTFEDAWREAFGDAPEPCSPLRSFFISPLTRARWENGDPLGLLVCSVLPLPPRWTNDFRGEHDAAN